MTRKQRLENEIQAAFADIQFLKLVDESSGHSRGTETHYKLELVSSEFQDQNRVQRQRQLMKLFDAEFSSGLHSISMRLMTPLEWDAQKSTLATPGCSGGSSN